MREVDYVRHAWRDDVNEKIHYIRFYDPPLHSWLEFLTTYFVSSTSGIETALKGPSVTDLDLPKQRSSKVKKPTKDSKKALRLSNVSLFAAGTLAEAVATGNITYKVAFETIHAHLKAAFR
jgi:hypothetical protein